MVVRIGSQFLRYALITGVTLGARVQCDYQDLDSAQIPMREREDTEDLDSASPVRQAVRKAMGSLGSLNFSNLLSRMQPLLLEGTEDDDPYCRLAAIGKNMVYETIVDEEPGRWWGTREVIRLVRRKHTQGPLARVAEITLQDGQRGDRYAGEDFIHGVFWNVWWMEALEGLGHTYEEKLRKGRQQPVPHSPLGTSERIQTPAEVVQEFKDNVARLKHFFIFQIQTIRYNYATAIAQQQTFRKKAQRGEEEVGPVPSFSGKRRLRRAQQEGVTDNWGGMKIVFTILYRETLESFVDKLKKWAKEKRRARPVTRCPIEVLPAEFSKWPTRAWMSERKKKDRKEAQKLCQNAVDKTIQAWVDHLESTQQEVQ